jgi:predicted lipoprotein with Yx(FWY)xxD motif
MKITTIGGQLAALGLLLTLAIAGCKNNDFTTPAKDITLETNATLGKILTGADGKTLYLFASDVDGQSACTSAQCAGNWPAFYKDNATLLLSEGVLANDFATITRTDGAKQTTYKGWPLYYFKNDTKAGDVLGENVGGVWSVAKLDYSVRLAAGQLKGNNGKTYTTPNTVTYVEGQGTTVYLADKDGRTMYGYALDKKNKNNYTRADFSNNATWPLVEVTAASLQDLPSNLKRADFSSISVFGRDQLTYKGWPLYYFGPDNATRGLTKGVSVPQPGVWPILNASSPEAPN